MKIDLAAQKLTLPDGRAVEFPVDAFSKQCLLDGVDEMGYILKQDAAIAAFEAGREGSIDTLAGTSNRGVSRFARTFSINRDDV